MFKFEKPKIIYNDQYKKLVEEFELLGEGKKTFFSDYNYPSADRDAFDRDSRLYKRVFLIENDQRKRKEYLSNRDFYEKLSNKLQKSAMSLAKSDRIPYATIVCPYTGITLNTTQDYIPSMDFKRTNETFTYFDKNQKTAFKAKDKYSVYHIGKIDKPKITFDQLSDAYDASVIEEFKKAWSFKKNLSDFDVPDRNDAYHLKDVTQAFIIVEDRVDEVKVYYPHTESFEVKKVYLSFAKGRYYKYKGKSVIVPSPDLDIDKV